MSEWWRIQSFWALQEEFPFCSFLRMIHSFTALQSWVSHDSSEIILMSFAAQEMFITLSFGQFNASLWNKSTNFLNTFTNPKLLNSSVNVKNIMNVCQYCFLCVIRMILWRSSCSVVVPFTLPGLQNSAKNKNIIKKLKLTGVLTWLFTWFY